MSVPEGSSFRKNVDEESATAGGEKREIEVALKAIPGLETLSSGLLFDGLIGPLGLFSAVSRQRRQEEQGGEASG